VPREGGVPSNLVRGRESQDAKRRRPGAPIPVAAAFRASRLWNRRFHPGSVAAHRRTVLEASGQAAI